MTALASDPAARFPNASSFAHAARRAVFPKGSSLLTGLPGLRHTTRVHAVSGIPLRNPPGLPGRVDDLPTQPAALGDAASMSGADVGWDAPGDGRTGKQRLPQTRRALLAILGIVVLAVGLCGGTSYLASQTLLPFLGFGPAPVATVRPTDTVLPSPTPQATATATPTPSPTPTPRPTATPRPKPAVQAAFVKVDSTTGGNWNGVYGSQGYILAPNNATYPYSKVPGYLIVTITSAQTYVWTGSTTDPRALQRPPGAAGTGGIAACWFSGKAFTIDVGVTDGETHRLAFYLLDWDGGTHGRVERIDAVNATSGATLDSRTVGQPADDTNPDDQFHNGKYLIWDVRGHVTFTVTNLNINAVVSGIFFD